MKEARAYFIRNFIFCVRRRRTHTNLGRSVLGSLCLPRRKGGVLGSLYLPRRKGGVCWAPCAFPGGREECVGLPVPSQAEGSVLGSLCLPRRKISRFLGE